MYHRHMQHSYSLFRPTEMENNFGSAIASHMQHSIIKMDPKSSTNIGLTTLILSS